MDILVYKDGRMVCTENPLKADSLEGLAMLVTNPQDGDVLKYDAASGTWLNGTGSDFAPTITSPQNGQVIKYNGTAWVNGAASGGGNGLVITPTIDLSNMTATSDKTAQEIYDAFIAGRQIVFVTAEMGMVVAMSSIRTGENGSASFYFHDANSTAANDKVYAFIANSMSAYPVCNLA